MMLKTETSTARKLARHPHPSPRLRARRRDTGSARVHASGPARTTLRTRVGAAFQAMAHGVHATTAQAHTKAFYRSSGFEWTRGWLTRRRPTSRARVIAGFQEMAHGTDAKTALAQANVFYHSSGLEWTRGLR